MNKDTKQLDILPFKHGQEGTHYACPEMVDKLRDKVGCCECNGHTCKDTKQSWEKLSDDLHELEDWELEFHSRFGGEKFFPYIAPSNVREFFSHLLTKQRHDLKEQVLEAVGEFEKISEESVETIDGSYDVTEDLSTTRNELRAEIKKR